ncbi:LLM class F420-dependent oxidoreductase [Mycobacterium sp. 852002-51057_SCH5723018]|uniref:LLM class F420-dependent oxidoreductase n=1 Tax=Mycobacterium sp. 852002-51057_SCH5723018 TaxID=1834094 RepID=UPI000B2E3A02|nr:LLM class F420-dependent oxidoreductase [Mycobacterium sp. 852002-51057_SCH5723018]
MTTTRWGKPAFGRFGVWTVDDVQPHEAAEIEKLGYGALWVGGSPSGDLTTVEAILAATTTLNVATGVVNMWTTPPEQIAESFHRLEKAYPGRFLLGVGIGHPEFATTYRTPYEVLVDYLGVLDRAEVPVERRVLAALGPKVLKLAAVRSAGAHPFLVTPEHTRQARAVMGDSAFLAPEHKVIVTTDATYARALGRETFDINIGLRNYQNNLKRLGFSDDDIAKPGSDRLADAVIAYGTPEAAAARLTAHLDAGADHVALHVLGGWTNAMPTLTALTEPLGLTPPR